MSKSGFYIAVACAIPNVPIQVTISEGALDAHFAILRAPSGTSEPTAIVPTVNGGRLGRSY